MIKLSAEELGTMSKNNLSWMIYWGFSVSPFIFSCLLRNLNGVYHDRVSFLTKETLPGAKHDGSLALLLTLKRLIGYGELFVRNVLVSTEKSHRQTFSNSALVFYKNC